MHLSEETTYKIHILVKIQSLDFQLFWMPVSDSVTWLHLILSNSICRIEQTATVRVDNGPIVTGASPGKLRQLNGNGQLFIGKVLAFLEARFFWSHPPHFQWKFKSWAGKWLKIRGSNPRCGRSKDFCSFILFISKFFTQKLVSLNSTPFWYLV